MFQVAMPSFPLYLNQPHKAIKSTPPHLKATGGTAEDREWEGAGEADGGAGGCDRSAGAAEAGKFILNVQKKAMNGTPLTEAKLAQMKDALTNADVQLKTANGKELTNGQTLTEEQLGNLDAAPLTTNEGTRGVA